MSAPVDEAVVALRGVTRAFGGPSGTRPVLADLDLTLGGGEIVAVVGPSGSGKTTLLGIVAGFELPDAGTVAVVGHQPAGPPAWSDVAVLPQSLGLLDELSVAENIGLPARLGGRDADGGHAELLERLGLDHLVRRFPDEISLGERQRVALARAVVVAPRLLLADEPVSHQNHAFAEVVLDVVTDLARAGTACLLATHDAVAVSAAQRVLELRGGRLHDAG